MMDKPKSVVQGFFCKLLTDVVRTQVLNLFNIIGVIMLNSPITFTEDQMVQVVNGRVQPWTSGRSPEKGHHVIPRIID
jgi:hypothetical protein